MAASTYPSLNITPHWADLNDHLIELVDLIPDGKMDWSPSPEQWNFRGILLHTVGGRLGWLANTVGDGEPMPDYMKKGQTTDGLKELLRESWERMARFLSDPQKLDAAYQHPTGELNYLDPPTTDGHYIAYHRFVHDVEHRGDVMRLLAQLGIDAIKERRRRPL